MQRLKSNSISRTSSISPPPTLEPKPQPRCLRSFSRPPRVDPAKAAIFEDLARNLEVPHALGMTTVLVVPAGTREVFREQWISPAATRPTSITSPTISPDFLRAIFAKM